MTRAADFVYTHLGRWLAQYAPANPKDKWRVGPVACCDACGASDVEGYYDTLKNQAVCHRCFTFYRQTPFLGVIGTRAGSLREGASYSFAVVTADEALLYLTTKSQKKMTLAQRLKDIQPMLAQAPELRHVRYRPLSERWRDMMQVRLPYVAFVPQGQGNPQALAAALAQAHVHCVRGQIRWLNKDGAWITLPELLVRQALALSTAMRHEKKTFMEQVMAQWRSLALGLPLQWDQKKRDEPEIATAQQRYPLLDTVMQTSPLFITGLNAIMEMVKTGTEEA